MPSKFGETNLGADCRDFTPHFIAAGRGTLIERLGFECRDGLTAGTVFAGLQSLMTSVSM